MKVNCLGCSNTAFGRTIYYTDMHLHDKGQASPNIKANPEDLLRLFRNPIKNGSDEFASKGTIVSAIDSIFYQETNNARVPYLDELQGNRKILETYKDTPINSFYAVCQPKSTYGNTSAIEQILQEGEGKFVGLKFHPREMHLAADDKFYDNYLKLAKERKLPCLFHSDRTFETIYEGADNMKYPVGRCEYSRPEQIYTLAKRHPDVPVIMGHMGGIETKDATAAVDVLVESIEKGDAKLYADISWVDCNSSEKPDIIEAIKRLKNTKKGDRTDRLLFGTDAPLGRFGGVGENGLTPEQAYAKTIVDVQTSIKNSFGDEADEIIDKIFYRNANELFFEKKWAKNIVQDAATAASTSAKKTLSKTTKGVLVFGAAVAVIALGGILYNKSIEKNRQNETL